MVLFGRGMALLTNPYEGDEGADTPPKSPLLCARIFVMGIHPPFHADESRSVPNNQRGPAARRVPTTALQSNLAQESGYSWVSTID